MPMFRNRSRSRSQVFQNLANIVCGNKTNRPCAICPCQPADETSVYENKNCFSDNEKSCMKNKKDSEVPKEEKARTEKCKAIKTFQKPTETREKSRCQEKSRTRCDQKVLKSACCRTGCSKKKPCLTCCRIGCVDRPPFCIICRRVRCICDKSRGRE